MPNTTLQQTSSPDITTVSNTLYNRTSWTTQHAFAQTTIPTNIHTANIIFTNIILNIPKSKMHSNCRLLPEDIVCKIIQRNNIRRANTCDPALKLLNEEITSDIQKHKQKIWKEHLDVHWDHRNNTHTLYCRHVELQLSHLCVLLHHTH